MKFKGVIQASDIALLEINGEEKMYTSEGVESLFKKHKDDTAALKVLHQAYRALKRININQQELY